MIGIVPAAVIVAGIVLLQDSSTTDATFRLIAIAAAILLAALIWFQSVRFAEALGARSPSHRTVTVGLLFPVCMLATGYSAAALLMVVSCVMQFDAAAVPYLLVAAGFFVTCAPFTAALRRVCHRIAATEISQTTVPDQSPGPV